jgi:hypothetical protein
LPRLKNPNHEKFAQAVSKKIANPEERFIAVQEYKKVYPNSSYSAAKSSATHLLSNPNLQSRIKEIILSKNSPKEISEDLAELRKANKEIVTKDGSLVEVRDNTTRLGAINTILRAVDVFGGDSTINNNVDNRKITLTQSPELAERMTKAVEVLERLANNAKKLT